ncbi:hypothetical protein Efla_006679 [Eimeria flavescens]
MANTYGARQIQQAFDSQVVSSKSFIEPNGIRRPLLSTLSNLTRLAASKQLMLSVHAPVRSTRCPRMQKRSSLMGVEFFQARLDVMEIWQTGSTYASPKICTWAHSQIASAFVKGI